MAIDSWTYRIHEGDCLDVMGEMPGASVDLIITSPPYAERRKDTYGGVPASEYVEWFLPRAEQMRRLLRPTGSFVLNIKEGTQDRCKETYVLELILALVKQGWRWIDEYIWVKTNPFPGQSAETMKNCWERLLHFAPSMTKITLHRDAVKIQATKRHIESAKYAKRQMRYSKNGSPLGTGSAQYIYDLDNVEPCNAVFSVSGQSRTHPAPFSDAVPFFFIRLLTVEGDVVLDPFSGSGTTYRVAQRAGRKPIGIEIKPEYVKQENPMLL